MSERMTRRAFVGTATVGGAAAAACGVRAAAVVPPSDVPPPADLVVDASAPLLAPNQPLDRFRQNLAALRAAGVDIAFVPVATRESLDSTLRNLLVVRSHLASLADRAVLLSSEQDLTRLRPAVGVVGHFQGLQMVGEQLDLLAQFRHAGILVMQLTGYWKNWNGDGCLESGDVPLTGLGRMVVREMARVHIILDLAQAGRRTSMEALELGDGRVIVSRANAAAVHPHPQNVTDSQIDAVRARGGVIGLSVFPALLSAETRPGMDAVLRHLEHLVRRAGIEHVGLGLDFDTRPRRRFPDDPLPEPPYAYPADLQSPADLHRLRTRLQREGWTEADIGRLFGGNFVRVLTDVLDTGAR
jgi:membrane dipeptidase